MKRDMMKNVNWSSYTRKVPVTIVRFW